MPQVDNIDDYPIDWASWENEVVDSQEIKISEIPSEIVSKYSVSVGFTSIFTGKKVVA